MSERITWLLAAHGPKLALVFALAAMGGSLYFSDSWRLEDNPLWPFDSRRYIPCELCWFQRILMYPLTVILLVGILSRDRSVPKYVLPLSMLGFVVATYHYMLQNGVFHTTGFCQAGVSCATRYINYYGFVTIPFLSQIAFALVTVTMFATAWAVARSGMED